LLIPKVLISTSKNRAIFVADSGESAMLCFHLSDVVNPAEGKNKSNGTDEKGQPEYSH
jgi:hypothetical protein